jgi:translation initiation factor IF-2
LRRDEEIARGEIVGLEQVRVAVKEVQEGAECGILVETKTEIAPGDILECIVSVIK